MLFVYVSVFKSGNFTSLMNRDNKPKNTREGDSVLDD